MRTSRQTKVFVCSESRFVFVCFFPPNSREETSNLRGRVSDERRHASPAFKLRHDNKTACERLSAALCGAQRPTQQPRTIISTTLPVMVFAIKTTNDGDLNTNKVYHFLNVHVPCKSCFLHIFLTKHNNIVFGLIKKIQFY